MEQEPKKKIASLGQPIKAPGDNRLYVIKERAKVGLMYQLVCPECNFSLIKKIAKEGRQRWDCPQCKAIVGFAAVNPTPKKQEPTASPKTANASAKQDAAKTEEAPEPKKPTKKLDKSASQDLGEFVWGGFFSRKHFALRPGSIYIGRKDEDERSDLQLTDKYVSRRSVKLDVIPSDKGYLFKMTVEHASNPVYVNSTEVAINNSIYLNYDDVITLGKTKLVFKKK